MSEYKEKEGIALTDRPIVVEDFPFAGIHCPGFAAFFTRSGTVIIQRQRDQLRETIRHSALHVGDTATVVLGVGANLNDHPNCHVVLHFCSSVMIVLERQVVSAHARRELPSVLAFASCEDERRILDAVLACDDSTNRILVLECKIAVDESAVRIIDVRHCHCNPVAYSDQACVCMVCGKDLCMDAVLRYRAQQVKQKEELVAV